jgi:hypothetical protein
MYSFLGADLCMYTAWPIPEKEKPRGPSGPSCVSVQTACFAFPTARLPPFRSLGAAAGAPASFGCDSANRRGGAPRGQSNYRRSGFPDADPLGSALRRGGSPPTRGGQIRCARCSDEPRIGQSTTAEVLADSG